MDFSATGLLKCARYAFAPNSLHYCGPEKQRDLRAYVESGAVDPGLKNIIHGFDTLYSYLKLIAGENRICDPFDRRVVEAYWLGNRLLNRAKFRPFARHLTEELALKKKMPPEKLSGLLNKLDWAVPQHTFHVLNVFIRTGHHAIGYTLSTMDACRISWGQVVQSSSASRRIKVKSQSDSYVIKSRPLIYQNGKLMLGEEVVKTVVGIGNTLQIGDWVTLHWGVICEKITREELQNLKYYTNLALLLANRSSFNPVH